jgi:hypothetical protein
MAPSYDWKYNGLDLPAGDFIPLDFWTHNVSGSKDIGIYARDRVALHHEGGVYLTLLAQGITSGVTAAKMKDVIRSYWLLRTTASGQEVGILVICNSSQTWRRFRRSEWKWRHDTTHTSGMGRYGTPRVAVR